MANGYAGYAVKGGKARIGADCVCLRLSIVGGIAKAHDKKA